jgi:hypothetical protein
MSERPNAPDVHLAVAPQEAYERRNGEWYWLSPDSRLDWVIVPGAGRRSEEVLSLLDALARQRAAVATFLTAEGHDLCHENRVALAQAFGLANRVPALATAEEFAAGCARYQEQIYGIRAHRDV